MQLQVVEHQEPETSRTRDYLQTIHGVLNADVWTSGDKVLARVEVNDWSILSDTDLRMACKKKLGAKLTPSLIMIERIIGERHRSAA